MGCGARGVTGIAQLLSVQVCVIVMMERSACQGPALSLAAAKRHTDRRAGEIPALAE